MFDTDTELDRLSTAGECVAEEEITRNEGHDRERGSGNEVLFET